MPNDKAPIPRTPTNIDEVAPDVGNTAVGRAQPELPESNPIPSTETPPRGGWHDPVGISPDPNSSSIRPNELPRDPAAAVAAIADASTKAVEESAVRSPWE